MKLVALSTRRVGDHIYVTAAFDDGTAVQRVVPVTEKAVAVVAQLNKYANVLIHNRVNKVH